MNNPDRLICHKKRTPKKSQILSYINFPKDNLVYINLYNISLCTTTTTTTTTAVAVANNNDTNKKIIIQKVLINKKTNLSTCWFCCSTRPQSEKEGSIKLLGPCQRTKKKKLPYKRVTVIDTHCCWCAWKGVEKDWKN